MALYEEFSAQPNRLLEAESSYLQSAAYQPVGWYEFTEEAFEEARQQDKPVFLDIGAAWCHWCHVMDRECYENPDIATFLNELFIPIKVDRDERPDIDARYQLAVQALTGQGGWPLTVFLIPDGEPFYGGTYFPLEDHYGRVGLKTLLPELANTYKHRRQELHRVARSLSSRTQQAIASSHGAQPLSDTLVADMANRMLARFNVNHGGFEYSAPKFPHPAAMEFAMMQWNHTGEDRWRQVAEVTLQKMACGGIFDQLGGGFHRYSTDDSWQVPHFEKMAYENALLLENYVHAAHLFDEKLFREVAGLTLTYILEIFADTQRGGFFSAQDADVNLSDDGSYWTWSFAEFVEPLMPDEVPIMVARYGVTQEGNMPESNRNVLSRARTSEEIADRLKMPVDAVERVIHNGTRKLQAVRRHRQIPAIDRNKFAGWNAMLISSLLEAGLLLEREDARLFALRSMDVLLNDAYEPDHGIYHLFHGRHGASIPGYFEDQVYAIRALLDAFAACGTPVYLDTARHLAELCIAEYWDQEHGGFFDVAHTQGEVEVTSFLRQRRKVVEDIPVPAANAMVARQFDRIWAITHEERYHKYAENALEAFAAHAPGFGPFAAMYGIAVWFHLHPPPATVIIGLLEDDRTKALRNAALQSYRPGRSVAVFAPGDKQSLFPAPERGEPVAYVCVEHSCSPPISEIEELQRRISQVRR